MTITIELLGPVIALVAWSMVMWVWMYVTRLPAMRAAKMTPDPNAPRGQQMSLLPPQVRWKADNYNHLMEQPTVFYALAISLVLLGVQSGAALYLAWGYVALRIVHSLVQSLINKIEVRFLLFALSNIPLIALTYMAVKAFLSATGAG
ncbi:MAPEG family protein [Alcanivorax sp. JB21]|uniref:MAPEG family protein n=1 Tax=Alcanivorax limicola TaxID=2874102 RepID=UPI001CBE5837|nr:MAPEG family protein [Alcanivorax limicola]MBZ2190542.1 MAPEG family protein [Alcanivorax limicola]